MFINEMEGWFGKFGAGEKQWISENLEKLDDEQKMNIITAIKELHRSKEYAPSIATMDAALQKVTGKKARQYYWAVCMECGCEYDFDLPMCPSCYQKGLECRMKAVRTSEFKPTVKVIRYNKPYITVDKGETNCYDCKDKTEFSFCSHFGQTWWNCKDYRDCKCNSCCMRMKKANERIAEMKNEQKLSYATPLKKVI